MASSFTPELIATLKRSGCYEVRKGKSDHTIWLSPISNIRFPEDNAILSRHTANAVLKQAGLPKAF